MSRSLCAFALAATTLAGASHGATILTFADPAGGGDTPLFQLSGGMLTGGWSGAGLTLETPGLSAPNYPNAKFTFSPVAVMGMAPFLTLGAGSINFFDSMNNPLATITFSGGILTDALGFGSSQFAGFDVEFTGPIMEGTPSQEAFSFSFANQEGTPDDYMATASFTSSANNVPSPASVALLGVGMLLVTRRRR